MNELKVFQSSEFGEVGVMVIDGKEYFPATRCAKILGYTNPQKAIRDHCKGVNETFTPSAGGDQKVKFIPEGDLYRLIVRSKLPTAERFERWVFDEVLPAIRQRGGYGAGVSLTELQPIINQTVTAAVSETIRQLLPLIHGTGSQPNYGNEGDLFVSGPEADALARHRRYTGGIVYKLDDDLKKEVDRMICSPQYSYQDIADMLGEYGIRLSQMAICRYAKRFFPAR